MQTHKKIELSSFDPQAIFESYVELYQKGLSLSDISKQTGKSKSAIYENLVKAGVVLRTAVTAPGYQKKIAKGKTNAQPPYGFCFFQGKVVPDQKEYAHLMLIYQLWKLKTNPNRISRHLNQKMIPPRIAKFWNRNSIFNILTRFEQKQIVLKGGQLELR